MIKSVFGIGSLKFYTFSRQILDIFQSSSFGVLVLIKIVNLILTEEYKLTNYIFLVLIKRSNLIFPKKYTSKSLVKISKHA